ncbi:MAG: outer membrane lipoprotein-sorting protein [Zetaproteobacteria bacterium]|nr:outer membrane lipoprotein-sorting protein [Zetaproteobacteria bacterium]
MIRHPLIFALIIACGCCFHPVVGYAENDARTQSILNAMDDLWRGESSYSIATMRVQTKNYTRMLKLEGWSLGKDYTLFRILEPQREQGTITLKSADHIYTYLPKTDRTIRLSAGMMMGSWMGSHLTHDDLVKESRLVDDFDASISFEGVKLGMPVIELTLLPKKNAAVVWGKVVLQIQAENYLPIEERYYDEDFHLARTFTFSGRKMLGGKERPSVIRIVPADAPDEFTEFEYQHLELNIPMDVGQFSYSALRRR